MDQQGLISIGTDIRRANNGSPLFIRKIVFRNSNVAIEDRYAFISNNFLVVLAKEEDAPPVWYNIDSISGLYGLTVLQAEPRPARPAAEF